MQKIKAGLKKALSWLKKKTKKNKKKWQVFALVLVVILILGGISLSGYYIFEINRTEEAEQQAISEIPTIAEDKEEIDENTERRHIDGVFVSAGEENIFPVAVIIDNYEEARPSHGLARANLVIEAPTEAGIPRFLAIYANAEEIKEIGPVRSARPYYLDWAKEFGALFMHVGGSPEALHKIKKYNVFSLNEYYNEWYYWRDPNRYMPHNVFSSSKLISKALEDLKVEDGSDYKSWDYKPEAEMDQRGENRQEITFNFSARFGDDYEVIWLYHKEQNAYARFQDGHMHQDMDGKSMAAKNIIIQFCTVEILDEVGRRRIGTIGEGKALVFRDGKTIEGTWKKADRNSRTLYYDENSDEVEFNAGTSWVEVLPVGWAIEY